MHISTPRGGASRPGGRGDRRGRRPRRGPRCRVVQICCKGPDRAGAPEENRWYCALLLAAVPVAERLCNRFGHAPAPDCPRSPTRISQTARPPVHPRLLRPFSSAAPLHPPLRSFFSYSGGRRGAADAKRRSRRSGPACVMRAQRNAIHPTSRRASSARHNPPALDPCEPTRRNASRDDITESTPPGRGRA